MDKKIFTQLEFVIQGEGRHSGVPMLLVRFRGCNYECVFCDTDVNGKAQYSMNDFVRAMDSNDRVRWVMITGGEPSLYPDRVLEMVAMAHTRKKKVAVESNGTGNLPESIDHLSISPKFSNAGERYSVNNYLDIDFERKLESFGDKVDLKFVVSDKDETMLKDIRTLLLLMDINFPRGRVYLMPEGHMRGESFNANKRFAIKECIRMGYTFTDRVHIF